jgi:transcriptional antiterminator RfaH
MSWHNDFMITLAETETSEPTWYCARTKPKHERLATMGLTRHLGLEVFHPRLRVERATRRGPVRVVEPLFPCYVFVRCPGPGSLQDVQYVAGVKGVVRFGQRIATVADSVVEELRQCFGSGEPMCVEDPLAPGREVVFAAGPFWGWRGIVVRVLPARQRVQILLEFLGRTTLAEAPRDVLVPESASIAELVPAMARPGLLMAGYSPACGPAGSRVFTGWHADHAAAR